MQIPRRKPLTARVGILGVGHHTYWPQFEGLLDEMHRKQKLLANRIRAHDVEVIDFGLSDKPDDAYAAVPRLQAANLDLLFIDMLTYATSSSIGAVLQQVDVPMVMVALQPLAAMPYERGSTFIQLCNDDICSMPEFAGVAIRMGRRAPPCIIGTEENDPAAEAEIAEWCRIAHVLHDLKRARLGLMGHVLEAMIDMHVDPAAVTATFGCHVALCEPDEILRHYAEDDGAGIAAKKREILDFFDTPEPVSDPVTTRLTETDLHVAAKAAVALEKFIAERKLDGLAYYYEGTDGTAMRELVTNLIVGNSLLTGAGFPMCGEFDLKTCVAMLIMDRLEIGGSFAEFHPVDFVRGTVLVGHDGPHHVNIADRKPVIRSLKKYHGKPGSGASVEFNLRKGPITMLSLGLNGAGKMKFVLAEGESLDGPIPPTGNTNTHGRFAPDVRTFLKRWVAEGPTHHFALGVGHHASSIERIASILGVECMRVTP